jgi:hypothetical protein
MGEKMGAKAIIAVVIIAALVIGLQLGYIQLPWSSQQARFPTLNVKLAYADGSVETVQGDRRIGKVVNEIVIEVNSPSSVEEANYTLAYASATLASGTIAGSKSIAVPLSALPNIAPKGLITFSMVSEVAEGVVRVALVQIVKMNATIAGGQVKVEEVEQYPKNPDNAITEPPAEEATTQVDGLTPIIDSRSGITKYVDSEGKVHMWSPPSGWSGDGLKLPPGTNNPMSKKLRYKVKEHMRRYPDALPGYEETPDGASIRLRDPNSAGLIVYDDSTKKLVKVPALPSNDWSTYEYGMNWVYDPATKSYRRVVILPPGSNPGAYGVDMGSTIDLTDSDPNT